MQITFLGAADTVTGSRHLVNLGSQRILLDCGLFQGYKTFRERNWSPPGPQLQDLDAVVLGGAYGPLAPWLVTPVNATLGEHVLSARWSTCDVRVSTFGEGAAVRGAAAATLRSVLASPWEATMGRREERTAVS